MRLVKIGSGAALLLALACTAGCGEALAGRCGAEGWAGGTFVVRMQGALDAEVQGAGMSQGELTSWFRADWHWRDVGSHYANDGGLGGLYGRSARDDDRGFAASVELPEGLPGCERARWLGVNMGSDPWAYVMLMNEVGVRVLDASTLQHSYADGLAGSGGFTTHAVGSCLPDGDTLTVEVVWQMNRDVHVEDFEKCERNPGLF